MHGQNNSMSHNQMIDHSFNQLNLSNIIDNSFENKRHDDQVIPTCIVFWIVLKKTDDLNQSQLSQEDVLLQSDDHEIPEITPENQKLLY